MLARLAGGAGAGVLTLVLRLVTAPDDEASKLAFYDRSIWTIALIGVLVAGIGAVRHPAAVSLPHTSVAAACAVLSGATTFVILNGLCFHSTLGAPEAATTARYSGALSALLVLPLMAAITLAAGPGPARTSTASP